MSRARGSIGLRGLLNLSLATVGMLSLSAGCSGGGTVKPPATGGQSGNEASGNAGSRGGSDTGGGGGMDTGGPCGTADNDATAGIPGGVCGGSAGRGGATGPDDTATGGQPATGGSWGSGGLAAGGTTGLGGREASGGSGGGPSTGGDSGQGGFSASGGVVGSGGRSGAGGMGEATGGTGGAIDQGSGGSSSTGSGGAGATCTSSAEGWQHVLSCDIVAPIGSFHACVDFFATAQSAPAVLDRETAACTDEGGTPSLDTVCPDVTSLGSCIDAVDTDATSADAEYDRPFEYAAPDLTAAIVAAACAGDGHPYVPAGSGANAGAPSLMICP